MNRIAEQRCFNHSLREAAARCPDCGRFYCRECITEHEEKVICAVCLRKRIKPPLTRRVWFIGGLRSVGCVLGLLVGWIFFLLCGRALLAVPSSFHEGTVWRTHWLDSR